MPKRMLSIEIPRSASGRVVFGAVMRADTNSPVGEVKSLSEDPWGGRSYLLIEVDTEALDAS